MAKIDFRKVFKNLYQPSSKQFSVVEVPPMHFLMLDGMGNPNTSMEYQQAVASLYTLAYTIKFSIKTDEFDYIVPPLEGLWWMDDMTEFSEARKDEWKWTMMILQPEQMTAEIFKRAREDAIKKKGLPMLSNIRLSVYDEGLSVQILYIGAYADEGPTIAKMHDFIRENGYAMYGKHHEIYLGDPRRNPPEKLKTIIRQPIEKL